MALRTSLLCCLLLTVVRTVCKQEKQEIDLTLGFIQEPSDVIAEKNRPFILNCSVSSGSESGPVNIVWRHKGIEINETRRRVLNNGSLYFPRIIHQKKTGESDGGIYQCIASNNIGSLVSRNISLTIANVSRKFLENPLSQTIEEGDVVRFACQIMAIPHAVYTWQRNRQDLPQDDRRITISNSGVLLINGVKKSDAGKYRCSISSLNTQRFSQEALLEVNSGSNLYRAPNILTPPYNITIKQGSEIILECAASGFPKPVITWKKNGKGDFNSTRIHYTGQGNLIITNVQPSDNGTYICNASNKNPQTKESRSVTKVIFLQVLIPPRILNSTNSTVVPIAKTARFECEVKGNPPPRVFWLKNGHLIPVNGRIKSKINNSTYALVILQSVTNDSGIYQCIANNIAGTAIANARLQINSSKDQPYPPTALRAETLSSTSIQVSWNASTSRNGYEIRAYTVHFSPVQGGDELQKVSVQSSQIIEQLKPFTNYSFYVRSYNGKSASDESETIICATGEDIPLKVPKFYLRSVTSTSLLVYWDELPRDIARGIIIKYDIKWRIKGTHTYSTVTIPGDVLAYEITGLIPETEYEVVVIGSTKNGYPNLPDFEWPWVTAKMPSIDQKVPSSVILDLSVINSTTILVKWICSDKDIEGFKLRYREQNQRMQNPIKLPRNSTQYILSQLVPETWYEVHMLAYNNNGDGVESVHTILTYDEQSSDSINSIIEPPSYLEATPTSSTSIAVSWEELISSKNVTYFTIRYNPVPITNTVNDSSVIYLKSTKRQVVITNLAPFTLYEFSVCSHDQNNKSGPYSKKIACKTGEDIPTAPTELHWKAIGYHSAIIMWQPPEFPNGLIVNYYVLYNTKKSPQCNIENWITKEEEGNVLSTQINGLASNTFYYFCLRAKTSVGTGPPTDILELNIRQSFKSNSSVQTAYEDELQDPRIGIIVGISIGVGCMLICALVIMIRNRFFSIPPEPCQNFIHHYHLNGNGHLLHAHCNGRSNSDHRFTRSDSHEMESFMPMLSPVNENVPSHLDTKGGYPLPYCPGKINGSALHPKLHESCILNGHAMRDKHTMNITVNPQHRSWDSKNSYHYNAGDDDNMPLPPSIMLSDVEADEDVISMSEHSQNEDSGVQLVPSQETESYNQDCCSLQGSESEQSSVAATAASGNVLPQNDDSSHSCVWDASSQQMLQAHQPS